MQLPIITIELSPHITDRFQCMWERLEAIFSVSIVGPVEMTIARDFSTIPHFTDRFSIEVQLPSDNREYWILDLRDLDLPILNLKRVTFQDEIFQRDQKQFLLDALTIPFVRSALTGEQWFSEMKKG